MSPSITRIDATYPAPVEGEDYCPDAEHDDHGTVWEPDEDSLDPAEDAARFLRDKGACHASASHWHAGMWYHTDEQQDYRTGEHTIAQYFLHGDDAFQQAVAEHLANARTVSVIV